MHLALAFLMATSILAQTHGPVSPAAAAPRCVRPTDFSVGKAVTSYEDCLKRREKFCLSHEKLKECQNDTAAQKLNKKRIVFTNPRDVNPEERCSIQRDGSYHCIQDPIRFNRPDEAV